MLLLGMMLLMRAPGAFAQTDAGTAEELMRSSGLWQQLATIAPQAQTGMAAAAAQAGVKPSPSEAQRLSKVIDAAYAVDRLRGVALATLTAEIRAEHVPALRRWYSSRLGRRITGLEETVSTESADPQTVARDGPALLSKMPAGRRALLEEIVTVTRSAETMVQLTVDVALAAQQGLRSVTPDAPGPSADQLKSILEGQRPQLLQAFAGLVLASYASTYASLPTSELRQYVVFLKSKAGRHFTDVGVRALVAALLEASTEFGRGLPGTKDQSNV